MISVEGRFVGSTQCIANLTVNKQFRAMVLTRRDQAVELVEARLDARSCLDLAAKEAKFPDQYHASAKAHLRKTGRITLVFFSVAANQDAFACLMVGVHDLLVNDSNCEPDDFIVCDFIAIPGEVATRRNIVRTGLPEQML